MPSRRLTGQRKHGPQVHGVQCPDEDGCVQIVRKRTDLHLKMVRYAECSLKGLSERDNLTNVESASLSAVATVMEAIAWMMGT